MKASLIPRLPRVRACDRPLLPGLHPPRRACVQYVEFMLEVLPTKTAKTKPLRLSVRREELCSDVIGHFGFHEGQCRAFPKQKLFQRTRSRLNQCLPHVVPRMSPLWLIRSRAPR